MSLPAAAAFPVILFVLAAAPAASPAWGQDNVITSESARRIPRAELQRRVVAAVGDQFTLVGVDHRGPSFRATLRTHSVLEEKVCSAAQLEIEFEPDTTSVPSGTAPGAIHVTRLPMVPKRVTASQVYRRAPAGSQQWRPSLGPDPCKQIDPARPFFGAGSASEAAAAQEALDQVLAEARRESTTYRLSCGTDVSAVQCRQQLAKLDPEDIGSVDSRCRPLHASIVERCTAIRFKPVQLNPHSRATTTLEIILSPSPGPKLTIEEVRLLHSLVVA